MFFLQLGIKTKGFIEGVPMEKESSEPVQVVLADVAQNC
jgi:hypothetical protein